MTSAIVPSLHALPPPSGAAAATPAPDGPLPSFREVLEDAAKRVGDADRGMASALQRVGRRGGLETHQLIALQAGVYMHAQRLELTSKLVDQCSGAVKRTLESQR